MAQRKKCKATTKKGGRCRNWAMNGSDVCFQHDVNSSEDAVRLRDSQVFTLRLAGASFVSIAERLGFTDGSGAYKAYQRELDRLILEEPAEARQNELARLDQIMIECYRMAQQGTLSAIDRYLKIAERRAKLLGIDAPEKMEITGADGGPVLIQEVRIHVDGDGDDD